MATFLTMAQCIAIYDLVGNLTSQVKVPFHSTIVKKLPNGQLAVVSYGGLHLYDSLETDAEAIQLTDGEYSDMDVYGEVFHSFRCHTSDIVTFAHYKDKVLFAKHSSWLKSIQLSLTLFQNQVTATHFSARMTY